MRPTPCGCTSAPTNMYNRTQILCTIGESVDAFCIPRQGVLPSPCAVTAIDGSVVTTQAARSPDSQTVFRVLAAMFFYGLIQWLAVQSDPRPAPLFAHFFWQDRKSGSAKQQPRCHRDNGSSGEYGQKGGQAPALFLFGTSGAQPDAPCFWVRNGKIPVDNALPLCYNLR